MESAHEIVGLVNPNFVGQASWLETQGRADVAFSSLQTEGRIPSFRENFNVFSFKTFI